ncbi:MAG TPA: putative PEP-binding protein, partial [Holophaga sp.]|nr:putative PEP-binding protein [Holophaga sp.]
VKRRYEIKARIEERVAAVAEEPIIKDTLSKITTMRQEVARQIGIKGQIDDLNSLLGKIRKQLFSRGFRSGKELYVQTLSQGLGLFAMAFHGKPILYRTTDFKSNEYRNLLGGNLFETLEDNPMLGYRGVSRNIHDWEIESFKLARGIFGGKNLHIMLPFVRTVEEATSMKRYLERVHKLHSGDEGLKLFIMSEIPSNAILAKQFIQEFDGFSIGSNDMTQMVLGTDRDNPALRHIYDEEDPAVVWALLVTIFAGQKFGKKVGFCGQGVSNSIILRGLVAIAGIVCASVVPDTYYRTKFDMAHVESENIPVSKLGEWLGVQHLARLMQVLQENKYDHIAKKYDTAADIKDWYEGELGRLAEQLRENLESPKASFYRQEMEAFRRNFHKPVLYASWDWPSTVFDALRQAGFDSYKEQAEALSAQRARKW